MSDDEGSWSPVTSKGNGSKHNKNKCVAQQNSAEKGAENTSLTASSDENSAVAELSYETLAVAGSSDENSGLQHRTIRSQ